MAPQQTQPKLEQKPQQFTKNIQRVVHHYENMRFWKQFFEMERIAATDLHEDEAIMVTTKNNLTGEEKSYGAVRLRRTLKSTKN